MTQLDVIKEFERRFEIYLKERKETRKQLPGGVARVEMHADLNLDFEQCQAIINHLDQNGFKAKFYRLITKQKPNTKSTDKKDGKFISQNSYLFEVEMK